MTSETTLTSSETASMTALYNGFLDTFFDFFPIIMIFPIISISASVFFRMMEAVEPSPKKRKQPTRQPKAVINLSKPPKPVTPAPILTPSEQIATWNLPQVDEAWNHLGQTVSFIADHEDLLTVERQHAFETLKADSEYLIKAFHDIGQDEKIDLITELTTSLQAAHSKLEDIQTAIKQNKEFRFRQNVERIHQR